jgi:hypothetical protein
MGNDDLKGLLSRPRISLDALRDQIHDVQTQAENGQAVIVPEIVVNRDGQISMGRSATSGERTLSTVPLEVFANLAADQNVVSQFLPRNAKRLTTAEGVTGWGYQIRTELKDDFVLFLYFDGAHYQVKVISPEVEARWKSPHTGHIYGDGRICFGHSYNAGMPTLRAAFAKSVLWANGMSVALKTGVFPFSINNP